MGTARGSTHGSWRPLPRNSLAWPSRVTVCCRRPIVLVGLNATRRMMFSPLEMPPWMPPLRLVAVRVRPSSSSTKTSLCSKPVRYVPSKPEPTSKPLEAGSDMHAFARSASSLSNTGLPSPAGTFRATTSTTPPIEFPVLRISSTLAIMRVALSSLGARTMLASTSSSETRSTSTSAAATSPTRCTYPTISTPAYSASSFFAIAPAATRPIVSRADERPPPATERMPYFASYAASACDGR
mmetsp:Transcript_4857/g.13018  ORF Transcript_4857/g.13018 Transcript_4857/m.13018 type:complete len:240 (+) Transcript_4857:244-963(+)